MPIGSPRSAAPNLTPLTDLIHSGYRGSDLLYFVRIVLEVALRGMSFLAFDDS